MKRNKKRWTWTDKQIKKSNQGSLWRRTAPTWSCKDENRINKTKTKRSIHKIFQGYDIDFLEFGRNNHRHSASWLYF